VSPLNTVLNSLSFFYIYRNTMSLRLLLTPHYIDYAVSRCCRFVQAILTRHTYKPAKSTVGVISGGTCGNAVLIVEKLSERMETALIR